MTVNPALGAGHAATNKALKRTLAAWSCTGGGGRVAPEPVAYAAQDHQETLTQEVAMSTNPLFIEPPPLPDPVFGGGVCQFYVSIQQTSCGKPATHEVMTQAGLVLLCTQHMARHNRTQARQRVQGKGA